MLYAWILTRSKMWGDDLVSGLGRRVDEYVLPYVEMMDFSGTILMAGGDGVLLEKAYGMADLEHGVPNTPETRFHVASLTKPFTATLILQLEENGDLGLNEPISETLPNYPDGDRITVHHLLTHTSGIPNYSDSPDYGEMQMKRLRLGEIVSWFMDKPLTNEPGERYSYSNSNYVLLAHIIETITASPYREVLKERVLDPIDLKDTDNYSSDEPVERRAVGYSPAPGGLMEAPWYDMSVKLGSGSLYSTARDLHRFERAFFSGELLSKETVERMLIPHIGNIGYGWFVDTLFGRRVARSSGSSPGAMAHMVRFLDEGLAVIYCSNVRTGLGFYLHRDLSAILLSQKYEQPKAGRPVEVDEATLHEYTGRYRCGGIVISFELKGGVLWLRLGDYPHLMYLTPVSPDTFFSRDRYDTYRFQRDADGRVISFEPQGPLIRGPLDDVWVREDV